MTNNPNPLPSKLLINNSILFVAERIGDDIKTRNWREVYVKIVAKGVPQNYITDKLALFSGSTRIYVNSHDKA